MHISTLKKHKILLLILFSFMLTGCSVDYTLELNDKVKETIKVNASGDINEIEQELEILTPVVDVFEEGHNYRKLKNGNTLTYSYTYDVDSFSEAFVADSCFDDFNFEEDENFYVLTAKGKFGCLYDNTEVKLNVVTDKYVSEHNGTKKGNTYTWTINKNNRNNMDIKIIVMKNRVSAEISTGEIIRRIFKALLALFMVVGGIYVYLHMEKENS